MKIPSPPLYSPPPGPGPVDVGPGGTRSAAYDGYYGPEDEPRRSGSDDVDGTTASSFSSSQHQHRHRHQQPRGGTLGVDPPPQHRPSPPSQHRQQQRQRRQEEYSYYGDPPVALYDPNDPGIGHPTQQQMPRPAEGLAQDFGRSSSHELWRHEGSHHEGTYHEGSWREGEATHAPPQTQTSSAARRQLLPSVVSLAQKLLPAVLGRLDRQDVARSTFDHVEDDFEGMCSPLGSPSPPPKASALASGGNLKTTGLEESDYAAGRDLRAHDERVEGDDAGEASTEDGDDPEMGTPSFADDDASAAEYLPRSAALLVSALRGSARKLKEVEGRRRMSIGDLPSLEGEGEEVSGRGGEGTAAAAAGAGAGGAGREGLAGSGPVRRLDFDREAEALLESIRKDDLGKAKEVEGRGSSEGAAAAASSAVARASAALDDEDEGSVGGDAALLERSVSLLRRDLRRVDFSHLDVAFDDGFGDVGGGLEGCYDGSEGALGRLRSWLSRGSIVEQKLINQYVHPDGGGGAARGEGSRYADNPVLVWSLALMWAFAVLIAMHPRLAELVEGGDPGQLVDFLEWLFG